MHTSGVVWQWGSGIRFALLVLLSVWTLKKRSLTIWIFWSMLAGIEVGLDIPRLALHLRIFSDLFLRLIQLIVVPMILGVLVTGIGRHGSSREVSRLAVKSLIYFEVLTTIALVIGLFAIHISKAGLSPGIAHTAAHATASESIPQDAMSKNLARAIEKNHILQVAVFAVVLGVIVGNLREKQKLPVLAFFEGLTAVVFRLTNIIMYLAPLAAGGALAYAISHSGLTVMIGLGKLVLTLYAAILAFILLGMLPAALLARIPLRPFLIAVSEPAAIAFATSTSEAALPAAMERMEKFGVPGKIAGFVIPAGYSFNLAGACLYLSLASIFMAQAGGIHLSWESQLVMLWTMMLTSKGIAGIPRAVFVVLTATAANFHLPLDTLPLLLSVDTLMDMGRATINVTGNCLASAVIARWEEGSRLQFQLADRSGSQQTIGG